MSYSQVSKKEKKSPSRTGTRKVKAITPASSGMWEGIEVPTGVKRDRMEHIDAALQRAKAGTQSVFKGEG
jgi:hypothetical protein